MTDESNSLTLAADGVEPHAAPQIPEAVRASIRAVASAVELTAIAARTLLLARVVTGEYPSQIEVAPDESNAFTIEFRGVDRSRKRKCQQG